MGGQPFVFTVFTKPWKMPAPELGRFVHDLGFDGVELPVRPGYQVEPERVRQDLPIVARQLSDCGVAIWSVAGPTDEATIATCGELRIPIIRVMAGTSSETNYLDGVAATQREYDRLIPLLDKHGVMIGVQNHCGRFVASAIGLLHCIGKYDPKHIGIVWDAAHEALNGNDPDLALDIAWSHLCMVNLKNAVWQRTNGPEAEVATWGTYWTSGRQ